jgi:hypothetical protein
MSTHRTPAWWRALSTRAQVAILAVLVPGVVAHELTHYIVAPAIDREGLDWDELACRFDADADRPLAVAVAAAAPLLVGYVTAIATAGYIGLHGGVTVPEAAEAAVGALGVAGIGAYLAANFSLYAAASLGDLGEIVTYLRQHRATTDTDTDPA